MHILSELWDLEKVVTSAERKLLEEKPEEARRIIESLSDMPLKEFIQVEEALNRLHNTVISDYVDFGFSNLYLHWDSSKEGYRSPNYHWKALPTVEHYWYLEMITHDDSKAYPDFVLDVTNVYGWEYWPIAQEEGISPEEVFKGFSELLALSTLRKSMRELWERLVIDIVRSRHRTPLDSVAKLLKLRLRWVYKICYGPGAVYRSSKKDEIVYLNPDPDYDIIPLVSLPDPPEAKVVYLVICPNCRHRNEQGRTTCENCNAPL